MAASVGSVECGGYVILEKIGEGTYGKVYKVEEKYRGGDNSNRRVLPKEKVFYALKKINVKNASDKEKEMLERETNILKTLSHGNIVKYYDSFQNNKDEFCLVMEYCDAGNLNEYITKRGKLKEGTFLNILVQIATGMEFFHNKNVLHRDLNPTNIFLTHREKVVKIGDFGVARFQSGTSIHGNLSVIGTPVYLSPEMLMKEPVYDQKVDIWVLGCTCYEMATGTIPFENIDAIKEYNTNNKKPDFNAIPYCKEIRDLVEAMLQKDSPRRPTAKQVKDTVDGHECTLDPLEIESNRQFLEKERIKLEMEQKFECRTRWSKVCRVKRLIEKNKPQEEFKISLKSLIGRKLSQRVYPVIMALKEIMDGLNKLPKPDDDLSSTISTLSFRSNLSATM